MADFYATNAAQSQSSRLRLIDRKVRGASLRCIYDEIDLATINAGAAVPSGSDIGIGKIPKGAKFAYGVWQPENTIATTTFEVGDADDPNRFRVGAVAGTAGTPVLFGAAAGMGYEFPAETEILVTTGTANSPTSGKIHIWVFYTTNQ